MLKRFIPLALCGPLILLSTACSPEQVEKWLEWNSQDPAAAQAWATNECGALCTDDWDNDGVVEPEPDPQVPHDESVAAEESNDSASGGGGGWSVNWDAVARCESGGNWSYPPVTNRTGTYTGGLMIWTKAWDAYGGGQFASDAYLTSKGNQIIVAERILADNGRGAWDCL